MVPLRGREHWVIANRLLECTVWVVWGQCYAEQSRLTDEVGRLFRCLPSSWLLL